jgi:regulator of protease activity HflC (stomatin/prohibitin superfamily)
MQSLYTIHFVNDGETGLLFYNGAFQRALSSGQYYFWSYNTRVVVQIVDTRVQQLDISGQEILTADKVSLRVNFVCSYQITDPLSAVTKLKDYKTQIYVLVQLILREFAGKYRFDELLRQKDSIGGFVLEKLKEREGEFYAKFSDAGVKDIILPGEIREIMNTVLVAEKAAQASVITRREETAATKSLLDTAKLMDENATLYKLKELEYLERICDKIGSISVDSGGGILRNLRALVTGKGEN